MAGFTKQQNVGGRGGGGKKMDVEWVSLMAFYHKTRKFSVRSVTPSFIGDERFLCGSSSMSFFKAYLRF